jgi:hypothetical protein
MAQRSRPATTPSPLPAQTHPAAKTNAPAHPLRKSRVPEGSTFWFLLIGAVVFFVAKFLFKGKKPAGR